MPTIRIRLIGVIFLALGLLGTTAAPLRGEQAPSNLHPLQPYTAEKSDSVAHQVDFSVIVTPPYGCRVLKVWLPIPPSDDSQEISERRFSTFPAEVEPTIAQEAVYGNQFAYFEFHNPKGAQIIRHQFQARLWDHHWHVEADKVTPVAKWPDSFAPYLRSQTIDEQAQLQAILKETVPQRTIRFCCRNR